MPVEIGISRLVYQLRIADNSTCTAFYMPWGEREYIVTAKHCVEQTDGLVEICIDEDWKDLDGQWIHCPRSDVDISAFDATALHISRRSEMLIPNYTCEEIAVGDECFFLGFPYGMKSVFSFRDHPTAKLTFPLVKRATVSAGILDDKNTGTGYYMDGHNNPGFSGGPVLKRSPAGWILFGVVSSYVAQENVLYDQQGRPRMALNENSGIFECSNIIHMTSALPE